MKPSFVFLSAAILCLASIATGADANAQREEIRVNYLDSTSLPGKLKERFPEIASIVIDVDSERNVIALDASHPRAKAVREEIAKLDQRPTQILMNAEIAEVRDRKSRLPEIVTVISKPTIITLEGQPAMIRFTTPEGKEYMIAIKAQVVASSAK